MPVAATLITSRGNQRVKQLRAALLDTGRQADGILGIEGEHLLAEALRSDLLVRAIFLREDRQLPPHVPEHIEVLRLTDEVFRSVSTIPSPQGIAALIDAPHFSLDQTLRHPTPATQAVPLLLLLDALQDPGNLGTLIRSAEAFGATGLLLLPGTASPWNGKALRASAGSAFRLPTLACNLATVRDLAAHGVQLLAATGKAANAQTPDFIDLTRPTAFLIGNEGVGLSRELLALAHKRVTLPCTGPVESLNAAVAGSLLLFAAQQQRQRSSPTIGTRT